MIVFFNCISCSESVDAKVVRMSQYESIYYGGSYYQYMEKYNADVLLGIDIMKSNDNKNFGLHDHLYDVFSRPVMIDNTIYYLETTSYYYSDGALFWKLKLYSYDIVSTNKEYISDISKTDTKRYGEAFLKRGNTIYIQTYDEDRDGLIIYAVDLNSKKTKLICKNLYAMSVLNGCNDNYKNYLICKNRTTGAGGFELSVVNLKTKKVKKVCKNVACIYVKGKYVYYVDKKGIFSEDASYMEGYKTAKIKKYKFGAKKSKIIKKKKVRTSTYFYNMTKNKVYFREVCEDGNTKEGKIKFK